MSDLDAEMDAMIERESRANRRRRWWLRAWSELKRQHGSPSQTRHATKSPDVVPSDERGPSSDDRLRQLWSEEFLRDCGIPPGVALVLRHRGRGTRLRLPLTRPVCLVGSAVGCDIKLPVEDVGPRVALFVWSAATLTIVSLSSERPCKAETVNPQSRWRWGDWEASVVGLGDDTPHSRANTAELEIRLAGVGTSIEPIPVGLSFLGTAAERLTITSVPPAASELAILLRTPQRVWLLNPLCSPTVCGNDRSWPVCGLDAGDTVAVGSVVAHVEVLWPQSTSTAGIDVAADASPPATKSPDAATRPDWEQFLLDQTTRLAQLQQSLDQLSRETDSNSEHAERRVLLEQIRRLAAACARDAAAAQAETSVR